MSLTDDFIQDEPLAYLVKCFDTTVYEYKVFVNENEADSFAAIQEDEAGSNDELEDWLVYPLYAASPLRPSR